MSSEGHQPSPPINNLLQPDMYNRLDAQAVERTRVVNTQLDERLRAQHRLLAKYRLAAERHHRRERERVRHELTQLSTKLPAVCRIHDFRNKFLYGGEGLLPRKSSSSGEGSIPDPLFKKTPRRGVTEERCHHPFCERFFIHHLPSKKKYYKTRTPTPPPPLHPTPSSATGGAGRGGGGGGGDRGGGVASRTSAAAVSDMNDAAQFDNIIGDVQRVNETRRSGKEHCAEDGFLTSRTEPNATTARALSSDVAGRISSNDSRNTGNRYNRSPRQNGGSKWGRTGQEVV
ncbi:hypothetical protein ACOMHN_063191 [Nucella lapillus]